MTNTTELAPCPFCNSNSHMAKSDYTDFSFAVCSVCGAYGPPAATPEEAAALWNRRIDETIS
jgi:Lar family restriction alleviation protein